MASTTTNIGLTKPAGTDQALISAINGNMDIIDTKIGAVGNTSVQSQITSLSDQIATLNSKLTRRVEIATETITTAITSKEVSVPNMRSYNFIEIIGYCGGLRSVIVVEAYDYISNIVCMIGNPTTPYSAVFRIVSDGNTNKITFNNFDRGSGWSSEDIVIYIRAFQ